MNLEAIYSNMQEKAANLDPIGATLKMVVDEHVVYVDGTGDKNEVSQEDKEADCVISTSMDTMKELLSGDSNPMMAVMMGKVKIKGDMGVAMKVQSLLA
ncbi:SCP2 sterol-binding domain-containing protein [Saprospiraceae bacterium]|jgi:acyl-CoA dehydrogenase|nr:SCP2 sterol-binding domain-containing protein [Saprospiraceae bacterium]MDG1433995.1 SCP2 sterol-binding domain-containing protein [Saprospiraceae bacterium]